MLVTKALVGGPRLLRDLLQPGSICNKNIHTKSALIAALAADSQLLLSTKVIITQIFCVCINPASPLQQNGLLEIKKKT